MKPTAQQVQEFHDTYLVANTPTYLYNRLRQLPAVQQLGEIASTNAIVALFSASTRTESKTSNDVATAYACIVALTYRPPTERRRALQNLDVSRLEWGEMVRDIGLDRIPAFQSHLIVMRKTDLPAFDTSAHAADDSVDVEFRTGNHRKGKSMKMKVLLCAQGVVRDAENRLISVFNLFEELNVVALPILVPQMDILALLEREEGDEQQQEILFRVSVGDNGLISQTMSIDFQDKPETARLSTFRGLLFPP